MYEREGALREAATVLSQMPLESGQKYYLMKNSDYFISRVVLTQPLQYEYFWFFCSSLKATYEYLINKTKYEADLVVIPHVSIES